MRVVWEKRVLSLKSAIGVNSEVERWMSKGPRQKARYR